MLAGKKPLACFCAVANELPWEEIIPEEAFAPYVRTGQILRYDLEFTSAAPTGQQTVLRHVLYALPDQAWRFELMAVLMRALHKDGGWNETCERIEGTLLGYTEQENEAHCSQRFKRPKA